MVFVNATVAISHSYVLSAIHEIPESESKLTSLAVVASSSAAFSFASNSARDKPPRVSVVLTG
ncbi:hypothetical protein LSUB1_G003738 [Lachnellula subtilissima]|uniref:Uncharacterized protein n=1 Tax=Lachnellula subtilissima TaxID=602034 RepID=A0A8H8RXY9_9HELO|nr:hypothetical protein LSUB1_G003738 [Lachnellula subtilissima]